MSIVVMTADHSASDFFLWRASKTLDPQDRAVALAHIPLLVFLPNALVEASIDPESTRRAARAVNRILMNLPLSQNDVPLLILRLLSHSSAMAQLHVDWRWHTIGGQQLSPHFRVPGHPEAVVMGIDGASMVFLVTSEGELAQTRESARPTINLEQAVKVGPPLRPAAAFLSDVLSGYAKWCWPVAHVRAIP
jgi:hypothetical protein